jgi:hypothetical protein
MTFDLAAIPTNIDMIHAILVLSTLLFAVLFFIKNAKVIEKEITVEKIVEIEKPVEIIKEIEIIKEVEVIKEVEKVVEVIKEIEKIVTIETAPVLKENSNDAALQLLSLLQQESRFIDFVQEDLSGYSDEEIGGAARVIHSGSQKVLNSYFSLSPVRSEEEESRITLPEGFNASEVRLTGNVVGSAPFTGTLVHKGWKVDETKLPKMAIDHNANIVASAEVEL